MIEPKQIILRIVTQLQKDITTFNDEGSTEILLEELQHILLTLVKLHTVSTELDAITMLDELTTRITEKLDVGLDFGTYIVSIAVSIAGQEFMKEIANAETINDTIN